MITNHGIDATQARRFASGIYQKKVSGRVLDQRENKRAADKAARDGRLIACLVKLRQVKSDRAILVTSSGLLRRACENREIYGEQPAAVPFGAVAYLVALLPGAEVNQKVLKRALFDVGAYSHQRKCEQIVLSVLEASSPFRVHRRRRGFLKREIRRKLFDMARQRGQATEDLEEEIRHSYESGEASDAIRNLVTEVAREVVDPTAAHTIDELTARIRQLEAEKAMLKRVVDGGA